MKISIHTNPNNWFYKIKKSDENLTIEKFIGKFNVKKEDFEFLNPSFNKICFGSVVVVPASQQYFHVVRPLETFESIAKMFNCSLEQIKDSAGTSVPFVGQKIFL